MFDIFPLQDEGRKERREGRPTKRREVDDDDDDHSDDVDAEADAGFDTDCADYDYVNGDIDADVS